MRRCEITERRINLKWGRGDEMGLWAEAQKVFSFRKLQYKSFGINISHPGEKLPAEMSRSLFFFCHLILRHLILSHDLILWQCSQPATQRRPSSEICKSHWVIYHSTCSTFVQSLRLIFLFLLVLLLCQYVNIVIETWGLNLNSESNRARGKGKRWVRWHNSCIQVPLEIWYS